ncbi:adenylate kinase [Secundilactobacillus paracollinoides]|uniref:Adenylate kinase n=2 Tax=Secundilactobacillus paracollinoides TaxID=240427 RepID=A0A1B2IZC4_9LACO|nr:adenylate kinase [Secundilactobacillus paracollinoides]ANZ61482.1 adenylate kinase [Secundilactobacillus paracollinoides]ANZ64128.1 adenylate kinase [Secundilactobacillus paracollinoides]ANZ67403.1 adenylate kinase [Secundilactobacillus paracollinoides]
MSMDLILMGLPGAGKGTQAQKIVEEFPIPHISTGDIFRDAMKNETEMGLEAKKYIDKGDLVPDSVTNGIVRDRLAQDDVAKGYMLDGYPRTIDQAQALDTFGAELDRAVDAVINIHVEPDVLIERLSGRYICQNCGATYHKIYNPTKVPGTCDVCGGHDFFQREDDKPETVKNRLEVNVKMNTPLVTFYEQKGLVHTVDGDRDIDAVYKDIQAILTKLA